MADNENDDYIDDVDDMEEEDDQDDDLIMDDEEDTEEAGEIEGEPGEDLDDDVNKLDDDEYDFEEDDDLTDFQKMLSGKRDYKFTTRSIVTKYEKPALVGYRAQMIAEGAPIYTELGPNDLKDPISIAIKELSEGKLPFFVDRPLPSQKFGKFKYETRTLNDLTDLIPSM